MAIFAIFLLRTVQELLAMPAIVMDLFICLFIRNSEELEKLWSFSFQHDEVGWTTGRV